MFTPVSTTARTGPSTCWRQCRQGRASLAGAMLVLALGVNPSGSSVAQEMPVSAISAGAGGSAAGGFIVNAGQTVIGRSANASRVSHAGIIPCLRSGVPQPGDCDFDGDLDYEDMDMFGTCMTGPDGGPVDPECDCSDFDGDTDTDLADWAEFQVSFAGP